MNRRNFLGLFTAAALSAGLGISPEIAYTEPRKPYTVRYVEAFDVMHGQMVHRIDIANGFKLSVPKSVERGVSYAQVGASQLNKVLSQMSAHVGPAMSGAIVSAIMGQLPMPNQIIGVSW